MNIPIYGPTDEGAKVQIEACAVDAEFAALMADHHQGYQMPIGGVCAYKDKVSVAGVGYDIGCGNKAVKLNLTLSDIQNNIPGIMDSIWNALEFGIGRHNDERPDHALFDSDAWRIHSIAPFKELARSQLGTIGSGNHYVDLFKDESDNIWVGVHFGSRGLGHKTATAFLELIGAKDSIDGTPVLVDTNSNVGSEYIECMNLAGTYASAGRDWVCQKVADLLGASVLEEVHNHHNFAWKEDHFGSDYWVVRKGATPCFPGQRSFIGGSMGDNSVIIEGVDSDESQSILYSTVHGAGRVLSRTQAAGKLNYKTRERAGGSVTPEMMMDWVKSKGVELRGAGTDESPHCYKRLDEVLKYHSNTLKVLHVLTPLGVCMAGQNEYDPYKD